MCSGTTYLFSAQVAVHWILPLPSRMWKSNFLTFSRPRIPLGIQWNRHCSKRVIGIHAENFVSRLRDLLKPTNGNGPLKVYCDGTGYYSAPDESRSKAFLSCASLGMTVFTLNRWNFVSWGRRLQSDCCCSLMGQRSRFNNCYQVSNSCWWLPRKWDCLQSETQNHKHAGLTIFIV